MSEPKKFPQVVINLLIVFCIGVLILFVLAIPDFQYSWRIAQVNRLHHCINNLRQIDGAKQQWALENHKDTNAIPTSADVAQYLKNNQFPVCPSGGTYTIGRVGEDPKCSILGHVLPTP